MNIMPTFWTVIFQQVHTQANRDKITHIFQLFNIPEEEKRDV